MQYLICQEKKYPANSPQIFFLLKKMQYGNDIICKARSNLMMPIQKNSHSTCFFCLPQQVPAMVSQENRGHQKYIALFQKNFLEAFCSCARVLKGTMAAAGGSKGLPTVAWRTRSFAELVSAPPQPISEVVVPFRFPQVVDGEVCVQFSRDEIERSAAPFRFAMVMKFLKQRPSLDRIRAFINGCWGLVSQPVVSVMRKPRNVLVQFSLEADFIKAMSRESSEIDGVNYRNFQWTVDFSEEVEPVMAPIWINLPGLAPNFYQKSYL
jgi:hypothetical protein